MDKERRQQSGTPLGGRSQSGTRRDGTSSFPATVPEPGAFPSETAGLTGAGRTWPGGGVVRVRRAVDEVVVPAAPQHVVLVNVGPPFRLEETLDGRVVRTTGARGDVALIPAGLTSGFRTRDRAPQTVDTLAVLLDPAFVGGVAQGAGIDPTTIDLVGTLGGRDPAIERIGMALLADMEDGGLLGALYAESLATALAVQLLRTHSTLGRRADVELRREPTGGLSRAEVRRVTDYVEANLERSLTLTELAAVARLSPYHFSRMFKLATGYSPHQFVLRRRVERATDLLANTVLPLPEVALRTGFADQSHLAKQTRRLLGTTPKALRRAAG